MAQIGGSDGDSGDSRYQKDLAESKRLAAKEKNSKSYEDQSMYNGGCMDLWFMKALKWLFIIFVVYALLNFVYLFGSFAINNVSNTSTISDFGITLYFNNILSLDRDAEFKVNSKTLKCYLEFDDALEETGNPIVTLKSGESFIYRGCNGEGTKTIIAIELILENPVYCYAMLPEEWSGNSFWGNDPSKFITEVKKKE